MKILTNIIFLLIALNSLGQIQNSEGLQSEIPEENTKAYFIYILNQELGKAAYSFTMEEIGGDSITLSNYRGKVVLLDFWALGCTPCYQATDDLIYLDSVYAANDFVIISMHNSKPKKKKHIEKINKYLLDKEVKYINTYVDAKTIEKLNMLAMPTFILVNKKGVITYNHVGNFTKLELENLESAISTALE